MEAICLNKPGDFERIRVDEPSAPSQGEALVRVHRVGVCGTDLHAYMGNQPFFSYPRIIGHELSVEVLSVGEGVNNVTEGDQCAVMPYLHCGKCIACRRGRTNCCCNLQVMGVHVDGGLRARLSLPAAHLFPSESLNNDQLTLVETLGIGANAVERAQPAQGENLLVIGAGPIGLSVIQFAKIAGARVMVLDLNEQRLAFCRDTIGVADTVLGGEGSIERVEALTDGELPTIVIDATGNPKSMDAAFSFVAHSGKLVFVGIVTADISFSDTLFHAREMTLLGSRNATAPTFERIIDLIEKGELDTSPWITHRASFADAISIFPSYTKPETGVIKAIIEMGNA